jgi:hypothetical protein
VATVESNSSIREWGGQKHAEDSGAQSDTKRRGSQGFVAWVPLLPGSGMEQFYPLTSSSELDLQNSQPVNCDGNVPHSYITPNSDTPPRSHRCSFVIPM